MSEPKESRPEWLSEERREEEEDGGLTKTRGVQHEHSLQVIVPSLLFDEVFGETRPHLVPTVSFVRKQGDFSRHFLGRFVLV